jgi:ABC-type lipoprotein release transport system permease subunit
MTGNLERQRSIIDFTIASLLRRKGKNGALFVVYTLIIFLLSSVIFFTHALKREAAQVLQESPEIIVQRTLTGRYLPIPLAYAARIRQIRGVVSVRPRLWGYYYDGTIMANYTFVIPDESPPPVGTIIIGSGIAKLRDASPGDIIGFTGYDGKPQSYRVKEVLSEQSQLLSADLILISEPDYRALSGIPAELTTDLVLKVSNRKEFATIAEKINKLLPDTRPIIRNEILRTYDAVFSWRSGLVIVIYASAALAFVIFAWDKATGLSAEERKEIGILKAVGWESSDVLLMKFWEGLVISLSAFLLGTVLGYLHVFIGSSILFVPVLKGWSTLYPEFKLVPFVNFGHLAAIFALTVVPYTITTIIPSWRVATMDPDSVLR